MSIFSRWIDYLFSTMVEVAKNSGTFNQGHRQNPLLGHVPDANPRVRVCVYGRKRICGRGPVLYA